MEWAFFRGAPQMLDAWAISGIALLAFGTAFRLWAIRTLDRAFSATVQIKEGQQLITAGPYRWLRHPSYTGAWLAMIGAALLMHSYLGLTMRVVGRGKLSAPGNTNGTSQ
ncbi:MAG: isoprenylcysteine carboxylmethyltransferase family protein [Flavobacteriales bacterium]|nr:isoprenylcysteine carboxylmethyltransferase family protein [Flavobacteriales bacterium]